MDEEPRLREFLRGRFGAYSDDLARADSLADVVDSLGLFELVEFVEREFGVSIPNVDFSPRRFSSIESILELVEERQALDIG